MLAAPEQWWARKPALLLLPTRQEIYTRWPGNVSTPGPQRRRRIPKDESGNLDLDPIREAAKQKADATAERDRLYRTYPLSVSSYAALTQTSIVDAIGHMANVRLPIRCCAGTEEEEAVALKVLEHDAQVVLDPSAVATLVHARALDLLPLLEGQLIVPRGLLIRMQAEIEDVCRFAGNGTFAYIDSRLVYEEVTEEQKTNWVERLRETVDALESFGKVVDGLPLAEISPASRKQWIQWFGWEVAEAMAVSNHQRSAIWTDDRLVSMIILEQEGIDRVWTEAVFKWASMSDGLPRERYVAAVADLVRLGYWHTKLTADVAVEMASDAEWHFGREPFNFVIEWLGSAGVSANAICALAEALLPHIYRRQNELISSAGVQAILGSIGRRRDARRIVRDLRRRTGIYCRLDFPVEQRLTQDFNAWLDQSKRPS